MGGYSGEVVPDMRRRPYSASHMSTAKQCILKLSAVSNTRARVLLNWQDSLTRSLVPEWQGCKLEKSSSLAKNDVVQFFPDFGGFLHPKV